MEKVQGLEVEGRYRINEGRHRITVFILPKGFFYRNLLASSRRREVRRSRNDQDACFCARPPALLCVCFWCLGGVSARTER